MTIQVHSIRTGLVILAIVLALVGLVIGAQFALHPHLLNSLLSGEVFKLTGPCGGSVGTPC